MLSGGDSRIAYLCNQALAGCNCAVPAVLAAAKSAPGARAASASAGLSEITPVHSLVEINLVTLGTAIGAMCTIIFQLTQRRFRLLSRTLWSMPIARDR
jgi:hypothetical protein